jgi:carbon-monoxide dehydrogenase medium subunit
VQDPAHLEHEAFSVDDSLAMHARPGLQASLPASDTGWFVLRRIRLARPEAMGGLSAPAGLSYIRVAGGELRIGSQTRLADLRNWAVAGEYLAILSDVDRVIARRLAHPGRTIGGVLCHENPDGDLAAVFAAARARMVFRGRSGTRIVSARNFRPGPYQTAIEPGELLTEMRIPIRPGGSAYEKVSHDGECPVTGAGAVVWLDGDTVTAAGLGLTPFNAPHSAAVEAEEFLAGVRATQENFGRAGKIASGHCTRSSGPRSPAHDKRCLAGELTTRALARALLRARAKNTHVS